MARNSDDSSIRRRMDEYVAVDEPKKKKKKGKKKKDKHKLGAGIQIFIYKDKTSK